MKLPAIQTSLPGLLCLLLLFGLGLRLWQGTAVDSLLATPAQEIRVSMPDIDPGSARPVPDSVRNQALFYASRRFFVASMSQPQIARPDYRLVGSFRVPGQPAAAMLLNNATGKTQRVVVGDEIAGWAVRLVESQRVMLHSGAEDYEITSSGGVNSASPGGGTGIVKVSLSAAARSVGGLHVLGNGPAPAIKKISPIGAAKNSPRIHQAPPPH